MELAMVSKAPAPVRAASFGRLVQDVGVVDFVAMAPLGLASQRRVLGGGVARVFFADESDNIGHSLLFVFFALLSVVIDAE